MGYKKKVYQSIVMNKLDMGLAMTTNYISSVVYLF
jgi:hypothetical protein